MQDCLYAHSSKPCLLPEDGDLDRRIRAEFVEMPGLKLTLPQAARLFNLEQARCECGRRRGPELNREQVD